MPKNATLEKRYHSADDVAACNRRLSEIIAFDTEGFDIILADPPYSYRMGTRAGSAANHYDTMSHQDLRALPVKDLAKKDPSSPSALLVWTTGPHLPSTLDLIRCWGFQYKTVLFTWVKTTQDRKKCIYGGGSYTRANAEFMLLATRGSGMSALRCDAGVGSVIHAPRGRHSRKPRAVFERIRRLWPQEGLRRIELFAREEPPEGWVGWGLEYASDI